MKHTSNLNVHLGGYKVGELTEQAGQFYFTYDEAWLAQGFNLSLLTMNFDSQPQLPRNNQTFNGIHGPFADSLPDGWGMLLMDRFFQSELGLARHEISPLDRLAYMGGRSMGALEYHPQTQRNLADDAIDLAQLYESSISVQEGQTKDILTALRMAGGSPGGARPKAAIALSVDFNHAISSFQPIPETYTHWIVKFRGLNEPISTGAIEQAYALLAQKAGVEMAETALIPVQTQTGLEHFFATKRFDRQQNQKIHMMSAAGLVYADFRTPCLDYKDLLRLTWALTHNALEVEKMARLMIFNGLTHNYDDHAKNFAFLHDLQSKETSPWKLAPAFDLTFTPDLREHTTAFNGQGKPSRANIRAICSQFSFLKPDEYIEQTMDVLSSIKGVFADLDIKPQEGKEILKAVDGIYTAITN